uniref:TLD family protein n=1 Tax=Solanum tuberosum TaxID=4113 RepID=M0ZNX4_SOLTU
MGICICFQVRRDGFDFANRDTWNLPLVNTAFSCLPSRLNDCFCLDAHGCAQHHTECRIGFVHIF